MTRPKRTGTPLEESGNAASSGERFPGMRRQDSGSLLNDRSGVGPKIACRGRGRPAGVYQRLLWMFLPVAMLSLWWCLPTPRWWLWSWQAAVAVTFVLEVLSSDSGGGIERWVSDRALKLWAGLLTPLLSDLAGQAGRLSRPLPIPGVTSAGHISCSLYLVHVGIESRCSQAPCIPRPSWNGSPAVSTMDGPWSRGTSSSAPHCVGCSTNSTSRKEGSKPDAAPTCSTADTTTTSSPTGAARRDSPPAPDASPSAVVFSENRLFPRLTLGMHARHPLSVTSGRPTGSFQVFSAWRNGWTSSTGHWRGSTRP